jgi:hypothetical protein
VRQPFTLAGWALDAAARDEGVDALHAYAYPATGGAPVFLGAVRPTDARNDVAGIFGRQFLVSGYDFVVRGLKPGGYRLIVYAHSTVSGTFAIARTVDVQIAPATLIAIDTPSNGTAAGQGFGLGGWAIDLAASSGGGVDVVHAYAYPLDWSGGAIFLGQARVGVARPDLAAAFGGQFGQSGFNLPTPALQPGRYRVVAYAHSIVSGAFTAVALVDIAVH